MNRRDLIRGLAGVVPGALAIDVLTASLAGAQGGDATPPVGVLNEALVLEHLQDEFYRQAVAAGLLGGAEAAWLARIGQDEAAHVAVLTQAVTDLGGTPAAQPAVDFGDAFADREHLLATALRFENACVRGYLGAAAAVLGDPGVLQAVLGIYGVEARHAALLALMAGRPAAGGIFAGPVETPASLAQVAAEVGVFVADPAAVTGRAAATT